MYVRLINQLADLVPGLLLEQQIIPLQQNDPLRRGNVYVVFNGIF